MDKHIYTDHNNIYKIQRKKSNQKGTVKPKVALMTSSVDS